MIEIIKGQRFNKLTVIKEAERVSLPSGLKPRRILCKCDCGQKTTILLLHLVRNRIKSCGCLQKTMQGDSNTRLGRVYRAMIQRCSLDSYIDSHRYKGRGIMVCKAWANNYEVFKKWALSNGWEEGLILDRRNNEGNYTPKNCRFVSDLVSTNNRGNTLKYFYKGEEIAFMDLLRLKGLVKNRSAIEDRISRGYDIEKAIDTPIRKGNYRK